MPNDSQPTTQKDEFSRHEVLHTAYLIEQMIAQHICEHPAVKGDSDWEEAAGKLHDAAWKFYQLVGNDVL